MRIITNYGLVKLGVLQEAQWVINNKKGGVHFTGLIHYKGIRGHLFNESFQCCNTRALNHKPPIESSGGRE